MALDRTELKIYENTGKENEKSYAKAIIPVYWIDYSYHLKSSCRTGGWIPPIELFIRLTGDLFFCSRCAITATICYARSSWVTSWSIPHWRSCSMIWRLESWLLSALPWALLFSVKSSLRSLFAHHLYILFALALIEEKEISNQVVHAQFDLEQSIRISRRNYFG